jgi:hypothetical protein
MPKMKARYAPIAVGPVAIVFFACLYAIAHQTLAGHEGWLSGAFAGALLSAVPGVCWVIVFRSPRLLRVIGAGVSDMISDWFYRRGEISRAETSKKVEKLKAEAAAYSLQAARALREIQRLR